MYSSFKKLLTLLPAGDKFKLFLLFIMMLIGALLEVIGVGMIPVFVSIVATPDRILEIDWMAPVWETLGIKDSGDLLVYGAISLIGVFIVKNAYIIFYKYTQARFIWKRFQNIGSNLFKNYMYAPYEFLLKRNTSELLRNVTQEAQHLAEQVMTPLLKIAMQTVLIIGIFLLLLFREPLITLVVLLILVGSTGLFLAIIRQKTKCNR